MLAGVGLLGDVAATFFHDLASLGTLTAHLFRVSNQWALDFNAVFIA